MFESNCCHHDNKEVMDVKTGIKREKWLSAESKGIRKRDKEKAENI